MCFNGKVALSSCLWYADDHKKVGPISRDTETFALLLALTLAICTTIALLRCCEAQCNRRNEPDIEAPAPPPATVTVVRELPQRVCSVTEDQECCICLDSFVKSNVIKTLPCGHEFHGDCIHQWLVTEHSTCPMCKHPIDEAHLDRSTNLDNSTGATSDVDTEDPGPEGISRPRVARSESVTVEMSSYPPIPDPDPQQRSGVQPRPLPDHS